MVSYNLLTEAWIPVRDKNGNISYKGILDTLKQSHELTEISDPAPPVQFGIYRLLIAFLMDVYQLKELEQLAGLIEKGKFDGDKLDEYARSWQGRFDLFDEKHPFMQVSLKGDKKAAEPVSRLMQHIPAGTNASHFHHGKWDENAYSFGQCARGLVTVPPFMTAGGAGLSPSINGSPPWYVLVKGDNLFHTLAYNMCVIPLLVKSADDHPPAWRSDEPFEKVERRSFSLLEGLTWTPRAIHLVPEEGGLCTYTGEQSPGLVRRMFFTAGYRAPEPGLWSDPQVPYVKTKDGIRTMKPFLGKALWRDMGPLMLLQQEDYTSSNSMISFQRPAVVQQFKKLAEKGVISKSVPLLVEVYGIRTDGKMKLFEWYFDTLTLPWGLLYKNNSGKQIQDGMDNTDKVAYVIKAALKKTYPNTLDNIVIKAQSSFWRDLKPLFERQFLKQLSEQDDNDIDAPARTLLGWKHIIEQIGYQSLSNALGPLDSNSTEMKLQVEATDYYRLKIRYELYPELNAERKRKKVKEMTNV